MNKQKGNVGLIIVIIIGALIIAVGAYYLGMQKKDSSLPIVVNNQSIPTPSPQSSSQISTNQPDLNTIKQDLALKDKVSADKITLTVDKNEKYQGQYASGDYNTADVAGGSKWYAQYKDNQWSVFYVGSGIPDCAGIDQYKAPRDFLSCIDAQGNINQ